MARRSSFVDYIAEGLAPLGPIVVRPMFGGFGLSLEGRSIGLIVDDVLYLKVDDETKARFEAAGSEPFTYEMKGKPKAMGGYLSLPAEAYDDADGISRWGRLAVEAAERAALTKPKRVSKAAKAKPALGEAGHDGEGREGDGRHQGAEGQEGQGREAEVQDGEGREGGARTKEREDQGREGREEGREGTGQEPEGQGRRSPRPRRRREGQAREARGQEGQDREARGQEGQAAKLKAKKAKPRSSRPRRPRRPSREARGQEGQAHGARGEEGQAATAKKAKKCRGVDGGARGLARRRHLVPCPGSTPRAGRPLLAVAFEHPLRVRRNSPTQIGMGRWGVSGSRVTVRAVRAEVSRTSLSRARV